MKDTRRQRLIHDLEERVIVLRIKARKLETISTHLKHYERIPDDWKSDVERVATSIHKREVKQ